MGFSYAPVAQPLLHSEENLLEYGFGEDQEGTASVDHGEDIIPQGDIVDFYAVYLHSPLGRRLEEIQLAALLHVLFVEAAHRQLREVRPEEQTDGIANVEGLHEFEHELLAGGVPPDADDPVRPIMHDIPGVGNAQHSGDDPADLIVDLVALHPANTVMYLPRGQLLAGLIALALEVRGRQAPH